MRWTSITALSACLLSQSQLSAAATYDMVKEYAGTNFFDGWTFYDHYDNLTNGDANFLGATAASKAKLAYVDPSTNHAIIKVDNTSTLKFGEKRNTVRMTSKDRYKVGSVWITDMTHVPYGCSVWPAFWSSAAVWPRGGEIDTFEGVNMITHNRYALHTEGGCKQVSPIQTSNLTDSPNCDTSANANAGCGVTDPSTASYGAGFAAAGGGVFVTEFALTGISIWFFQRSAVPASLSSNSSKIDTSTLGIPTANWPNTGCSINEFFEAQHLVFDITLCGDYANAEGVFYETCKGSCYNDYVLGPPSGYDNAYFEVNSVRVYGSTYTVLKGLSSGATTALTIPTISTIGVAVIMGITVMMV